MSAPSERDQVQAAAAELRKVGEAIVAIANVLEGLPSREAAIRVIRAAGILHGIEIPPADEGGKGGAS